MVESFVKPHRPTARTVSTAIMFFHHRLEREMDIHPSFFGAQVEHTLRARLYHDMEGSCNGEFYIIAITNVESISPGKTTPGSGTATFNLRYTALVWKPFKNETVGREVCAWF